MECENYSNYFFLLINLSFCIYMTAKVVSKHLFLLRFIRKTLEMHMETCHSTCQSEPTHQKDLRCPFCLYQTKNKNNMIDHIVLHRGRLDAQQDPVFPPTHILISHIMFSLSCFFCFQRSVLCQ